LRPRPKGPEAKAEAKARGYEAEAEAKILARGFNISVNYDLILTVLWCQTSDANFPNSDPDLGEH